jgi:hypothetical protein
MQEQQQTTVGIDEATQQDVTRYSVRGRRHGLRAHADPADQMLVLRQCNSDGSVDLIYVEKDSIPSLETAIAAVKKELNND